MSNLRVESEDGKLTIKVPPYVSSELSDHLKQNGFSFGIDYGRPDDPPVHAIVLDASSDPGKAQSLLRQWTMPEQPRTDFTVNVVADAGNFFNPPAIVEVYLTEVLTDQEIGLYHFHLGEMQHCSVGTNVHLVGRRDEADGTVLRFQAPTYEQIYRMLPVLLAPFRRSRAIDWTKTYQNLPGPERGQVLTEVVRFETAEPQMLGVFAYRLSEGLGNFPYANVRQIRDGRDLAVRIDVATNLDAARKLDPKYHLLQKTHYHLTISGGDAQLTLEGPSMSSQEIKAGGHVVATAGEGHTVTTGDLVFQQSWNEAAGSIDLAKLADELAQLRAAMKQEATEPEHDVATGNVAMAEKAAKAGDGPKVLMYLKAAGQWALDIASKVCSSVATDALMKAIGVGKP